MEAIMFYKNINDQQRVIKSLRAAQLTLGQLTIGPLLGPLPKDTVSSSRG